MKNTVNARIVELLKSSGKDQLWLASQIGKNPSTVYRIINGDNEPSKTTVKLIADALNANYDYLITGDGQKDRKKESENPYKDALVAELKDQVEFLKTLVYNLTGGKQVPANFLKALSKFGGPGNRAVLSEAA